MSTYQSTLLGRTKVAEDTMVFRFRKPKNFVFKAGQCIDSALLDSALSRPHGLTHTFSIASIPSAEGLVVTTRIRATGFKRAFSVLSIGAEVRVDGPMGSCTLHNNTARSAVLLADGFGIAPFLSILSHVAAERLRHPIFLFYAKSLSRGCPVHGCTVGFGAG